MTTLKQRAITSAPGTARSASSALSRWRTAARRVPEALTVAAVVFNLLDIAPERLVVNYPNDSQTHLQMVQWAQRMLSRGQLPFDHWYAHLSLGSPFFVQYQSFSAVITGALGLAVGARNAYAWTLYLLLALWPLCVYWSARLLRWGRWEAGLAAAMAPLLWSVTGRGFEHQAYSWVGSGLWSELWAMWTLPLALGFAWRYLTQRRYLFGAVLCFSLTIAFHFLMAYLAAILLVVMALLAPREFWVRIRRGLVVGVLALLATLWVTVPLLAEAKWTALNEFQVHTTIDDSYGASKVLHWLVTGQIYDSTRFPVITLLVAIGLVACCLRFRHEEKSRFLVAAWLVSLLLYFGRPTLGFLLDRLPGSQNLLFQRFLAGLHLSGLLLAAVGAVALVQWAIAGIRTAQPAVLEWFERRSWTTPAAGVAGALLAVGVLSPAWLQIHRQDARDAYWISLQRSADATQGTDVRALLSLAAHEGGGRVFAGMPSFPWARDTFLVGGVPVYIYMENSSVDAVGFTFRGFGLMTDPEAWFDQYNLGDYRAFGIHYLLYPVGRHPSVPARLLTTSGQYALWSVATSGVVQVVDTTTPIPGNASDLGPPNGGAIPDFLWSSEINQNLYPTIAYDGQPAAAPTVPFGASQPPGPAGTVLSTTDDLTDGYAASTVDAHRTAVVLLSASFDPGWSVTVDGHPAPTEMVAPALVGVTVAKGEHRVVFEYHGFGEYPLLFVIALLTLLGTAVGPRTWRRWGSRLRPHRLVSAGRARARS